MLCISRGCWFVPSLRSGGCSEGGCRLSEKSELERLQGLLERLEAARARLEGLEDPEQAVEVLGELNELAREVQAEVERARREAAG